MLAQEAVPSLAAVKFDKAAIDAIRAVAKAVNAHSRAPILANVFLRHDGKTLTIAATDLELHVTYRGPHETSAPFATTLPAKQLVTFLKGAKSATLVVREVGSATLSVNGATLSLFTLPADEYPQMPSAFDAPHATVALDLLLSQFARAADAASDEQNRGEVLMGTLLEIGCEEMTPLGRHAAVRFTATDRYQLRQTAIFTADELQVPKHGVKAIVPSRVVRLLQGLPFTKKQAPSTLAEIRVGDKQTQFAVGAFEVTARNVDGQYPNYRQVIPTYGSYPRFFIAAPALREAVAATAKVFGDRANMVKLTHEPGILRVSASSAIAGSFEQDVTIESGAPCTQTVAFNGEYLAGILALFAGEVVFQQEGPLTPVLLADDARQDTIAVLMPLRQ